MPNKWFHGRTATVYDVNPRSVGVKLLKRVKQRYMEKRIHVRLEHVRKSDVRGIFKARV